MHRNDAVSILVLVDVPLEFYRSSRLRNIHPVSILVLVDVPLEFRTTCTCRTRFVVSILVLVDVPLESLCFAIGMRRPGCFNPCFSGCAS